MAKENEPTVCIPLSVYRQFMLELRDRAQKEIDHGSFDLRKIDEIRKAIKKLNPEVLKNEQKD